MKPKMPEKKTQSKKSTTERTDKIYITMRNRYIRALEVLAGDPKDKSRMVETLIDWYIESKEDHLKNFQVYDKVKEAIIGSKMDESIETQKTIIEGWVNMHPEDLKLKERWLIYGTRNDIEGVQKIYSEIIQKAEV